MLLILGHLALFSFHREASPWILLEGREHLLGFDIRLVLGRVHKTTSVLRHRRNTWPDYLWILGEQLVMPEGVWSVTSIDAAIFLWSWGYRTHLIVSATFPYRWDFRRKYLWNSHRVLLTVHHQVLVFGCLIEYYACHGCRLVDLHCRTESIQFHDRVCSRVFITWQIRCMFVAATTRIAGVSAVWSQTLAVRPAHLGIWKMHIRLVQITAQANEFISQLRALLQLLLRKLLEKVHLLFFVLLVWCCR